MLSVCVMTQPGGGHVHAAGYNTFFLISLPQTVSHHAYSASPYNVPSRHTYTHAQTHTHRHTPLLTNDFLIPEQYPLREPDVRRRGGWFYHIWDTIPLWTAARSGEIGMGREAAGDCLSVTSLSEKKKKVKTLGFLFTVANSFQSVKRPFCSA